jgi:DNA-binding protein YbaB
MEYPALDQIESLVKGLSRMRDDLSAKLVELSEAKAKGTSDSGLVAVRVRANGAIDAVRVDPRAMRMASADLAEEFRQAAVRAQEAASAAAKERVRTLLEPLPDQRESTGRGY